MALFFWIEYFPQENNIVKKIFFEKLNDLNFKLFKKKLKNKVITYLSTFEEISIFEISNFMKKNWS